MTRSSVDDSRGAQPAALRRASAWSVGAFLVGLVVLSPLEAPWVWPGVVAGGFAASGWLAGVDLGTGRIPNRIVVASVVLVAAAVGLGALVEGDEAPILHAAAGTLVVGGPWVLVYVVSNGRAVGGGDVKLAVLVGVLTGLVDVIAAQVALAASLLGWVVAGLWVSWRAGRRRFAFGPVLLIAGLAGLAVAVVLARGGVRLGIETAGLLAPMGWAG